MYNEFAEEQKQYSPETKKVQSSPVKAKRGTFFKKNKKINIVLQKFGERYEIAEQTMKKKNKRKKHSNS